MPDKDYKEELRIAKAIISEMTDALNFLGAKSDLLSIVCSYGDTLDDDEVLEMLQQWNEAVDKKKQRRTSVSRI